MELDRLTEIQKNTIQKSRNRVIESLAENMDLYGVTLSTGHLYGMLFFQDEPMSLDAMGAAMGMSKTSMSTGARTLMDLKMVKKRWGKGSRKDLYEIEPDWHQNFIDFFSIRWRSSIDNNLSALRKSLQDLQKLREQFPDDEALMQIIERDTEKMKEAVAYYRWLTRFIEFMESDELFTVVPKESELS